MQKSGFGAEAIHGNKSQNQRERVLADFRNGTLRILIATDIAARGIDVDGVSHVVNYDLPNIPESYVHRIGRTARAGADGIAISFCDHEEAAFLRDIERMIRITIPSIDKRTGIRPAARPADHHQASNRPNRGRLCRQWRRQRQWRQPQRRRRQSQWRQPGPAQPGQPGSRRQPADPARGSLAGRAKQHRKRQFPPAHRQSPAALTKTVENSPVPGAVFWVLPLGREQFFGYVERPQVGGTGRGIGWRRKNCWNSTGR